MISVLIPIYNYNTTELVNCLYNQLSVECIPFEIVCINDASSIFISENASLSKVKQVKYISLKKNRGRSKTRNLLAESATFNWLLFLDADVIPESDFFIKKYIRAIKSKKALLYFGGVINKKNKPKSDEMLRWVYGKKREDINFKVRQTNPYRNFLSANFLVSKSTFDSCRFNENIHKYGYEDFVFAENLKRKNIAIEHIDNSVFHNGIEKSKVFLEKTKEAIENLYNLKFRNLISGKEMKLLRYIKIIERLNIVWLFSDVFSLFQDNFENNLKGRKPSLVVFDLYKLTYYCFLIKNKHPNLSY